MSLQEFDFSPLLENIVSFIDEGVIIADGLGTVLYHNPAVYNLLGVDSNKPIKKMHQLGSFNLQKAILRAAIDANEVDAAGKPSDNFISFEQSILHDGNQRMVKVISRLITSPNKRDKHRLVLLRDQSDTHKLEDVMNPMSKQLITQDTRLLEIIDRVYHIAPTNAFILLQGESGTGKTQLARMIHAQSQRAIEPFVEVNCAAIPETLIESELFGHVKGAFTGASNDRAGRFKSAHKGTLFLDEVGEIPLHLQAKLLHVIQDQQFQPVGSDETVNIDVRIIAASNKDLREMVEQGLFRADLFYRLAVIPITIPALKERPDDIIKLSKYFCSRLVSRGYPENVTCTPEAKKMMLSYPWPGNVRELENAIEHGLICAVDGEVKPESLPQNIQEYFKSCTHMQSQDKQQNEQLHAREIESVLKLAEGNKAKAARILNVNRTTLWRWIHKYNIVY